MYGQLLGLVLFGCQIILNESSVIHGNRTSAESTTLVTTRPATLPEGYILFPEDHAAYKIYEEPTSWHEARDICISENARLAITDSVSKIVHINGMKDDDWGFEWLHVGIYHSNASNEWVRVDNGLSVASVPWALNNPDGTGECAGISFSEDGLVDYPCDDPEEYAEEYFVCEIVI